MSRRRTCYAVALFLTISTTLYGGVNAKGAGDGGGNQTSDYGDQVVLYRDSFGVPVLSEVICPEEAGEECDATEAIGGLCLQPIASEEFAGCTYTDEEVTGEAPVCLVPVDQTTCAANPDYEYLLTEVEFGRINLVRSPEAVLESQLEEALYSLTSAGCLSKDAAGRFVYSTLLSDGELVSQAIDSPLQNLAIFWKLIKDGELGGNIDVGSGYDLALTAARALGASSEKTGEITVDQFSYLTEMFGLTEDDGSALFDTLPCIDVRQEYKGEMVVTQKCYLDLSGFSYDRGSVFNSLPSPAYIPASDPVDGFFEYLELDDSTGSLSIVQGPILEAVPELSTDPNLELTGLKAFVQAADDTRATIEFMHTWEVPEVFKTPVNCQSGTGTWFDVSISERSGLQVPTRILVGADEREMLVTISNSGPSPASGTVYVYAMASNNLEQLHYSFSAEFAELEKGDSASWTDIIPPVEEPCILIWTAVVVTELPDGTDQDLNPENNTVTEITNAISSGSGSGH